jgi:hypothetical protein
VPMKTILGGPGLEKDTFIFSLMGQKLVNLEVGVGVQYKLKVLIFVLLCSKEILKSLNFLRQ